jgi:hypothetical protein
MLCIILFPERWFSGFGIVTKHPGFYTIPDSTLEHAADPGYITI